VKQSPYADLAGIVDIDDEALNRVSESVGVEEGKRFRSIEDALRSDTKADTALVVVPPERHVEVVRRAIDAGLNCLVEKPFAPTVAEARALVDLAKSAGTELMVTQSFRFKRGPQTVKRFIERGGIGEIEAVYGRFMNAPPFTGFRVEMDEPLLVDMSVHHFDFIRGILGLEPVSVWATSFNPSWSRFKGNACLTAKFETVSGATIVYTGSWCSRGPATSWDGEWDIQGTRGALVWKENRVHFYPSEFGEAVYFPGTLQRGGDVMEVSLVELESEERGGTLAEFNAALGEGRRPEASGEDNLRTLALVLGAVESVRTGRAIDVAEVGV
jgi:predicted dehydrogenase